LWVDKKSQGSKFALADPVGDSAGPGLFPRGVNS
jgi:hypothetical protein